MSTKKKKTKLPFAYHDLRCDFFVTPAGFEMVVASSGRLRKIVNIALPDKKAAREIVDAIIQAVDKAVSGLGTPKYPL